MEVYLDNSATTQPYKEVAQVVFDTMMNTYGNPSSLHRMGKSAEDLMTKCREVISSTVYGTPDELYFTSGGTESDNMAIIGYAMANKRRGNRVITQVTEHKAVLESFAYLEKQGFDVQYIAVDESGLVDMDALRDAIDDNTILVSIMAVNNETGAIQPMDRISAMIDHTRCAFHVDAVQAYGKLPINVRKSNIDMLTISAHKIHGPNGVGALYLRRGIRINPVVIGGQQEKSLRSGTENLAGIAGFAKAAEIRFAHMDETAVKIAELKSKLSHGLSNIAGVVVNSAEDSLYSILNVSFTGVRSEVLLHILESKGIYVSSGSACNSKKGSASYVLSAMNLGRERVDGAIRFSLSEFNTEQEIEYVCQVAAKEVPLLAQIMNRR